MTNTAKSTTGKKPEIAHVDTSKKPGTNVEKSRVEKVADKAAHKAAKTEQEYDKEQTIISK